MYSLRDYGNMISDEPRVARYVEALRHAVKPGSVVLDIGTGTGVLAIMACRLGARRVFAIEPGDVIELAREIAQASGCGRIEFFHALSTDIELPERADVVVAEIHGVLPLFEKSLATLVDARARLLAPGGTMIPARETVWASVVEAPALHARLLAPWGENPFGIDMSAGRRHVTSELFRCEFGADELLAPPARWAVLDYAVIAGPDVHQRVSLQASRPGACHGVALWFDSELAPGIELSNAPGKPRLIFGNGYLPWPKAVRVAAGDVIEIDIAARFVGGRYLWRWDSRVVSGGKPTASFRQSQLDAALIVPEKLRRQSATHVAKLNGEGEVERFILGRMGDGGTLGDIAREAAERFPTRFRNWHDALNSVGEVALRFSD